MSATGNERLPGWSQTRAATGSFTSVQRTALPAPVVEQTTAGAERLGELYWDQLERSTLRTLRVRPRADGGREITVLGIGPPLLRFGRAEYELGASSVASRYRILGGLLARAPGGSISFTQTVAGTVEVQSEVDGFFPRLATRRLRHGWNGLLYQQLQTRLHVALGRRWFARLRTEAAR
jgi:hypothetical protein